MNYSNAEKSLVKTISIPTAAKIADLGERRIRALMSEGAFKRVELDPNLH